MSDESDRGVPLARPAPTALSGAAASASGSTAPPAASRASGTTLDELTGELAIAPRLAPTTAQTATVYGDLASRRRRVGISDLRVFPVALSGNVFGWTADGPIVDGILDVYRAQGGNFLDTADSYAAGRSETMIGRWMRDRGARDDMVLATKVGKSDEHPGLSGRAVTAAVEASLRRLQTDRIDLLYLHIDDPEVEFDETLLAVDDLIRAGKVRWFGGSDHTGERLFLARVACAHLGVAPMIAVQNQYSLLFRREFERDIAPVAAQQGLAMMPRFPLAGGALSGKYRGRRDLPAGSRGRSLAQFFSRSAARVVTTLRDIGRERDAAPATVALAWLLSKPLVTAPVVSASSPEQVFDLTQAATLALTRQQVERLDRASEGF